MPSDHRLHPSSIVFALAGSLRAFLVPAVVLILTSGRSSPQASDPGWGPTRWMNRWIPGDFEIANWQFWLLLFLIPTTIAALVHYFTFRLRYEGTELVISSGILFRNERHVPYARIQNLDAVRNIVHRLLGVAEVRVETGGGSAVGVVSGATGLLPHGGSAGEGGQGEGLGGQSLGGCGADGGCSVVERPASGQMVGRGGVGGAVGVASSPGWLHDRSESSSPTVSVRGSRCACRVR